MVRLLGSGRCCAASYIVWRFGEASAISDHWQKIRARHHPPFRGLHRGDLIAMNRKNVSAWRDHIRKPTEARIVNDVLASPSHPGHD
jgi:hypothetical protein